MADRWFRFYDGVPDDPKALKLSDKQYRAWTFLLCIASRYEGEIAKDLEDAAIIMRTTVAKLRVVILEMIRLELFDETETGYVPHNWNARQFKSDVSTDRVRALRERKRNVSPAVPETRSEDRVQKTETEKKDDEEDAHDLLTRICTILRLDLKANPERITWFRQVQEMLRDGLDSPRIIAATEIARTHGKLNLAYIRSVAFNPPKPQQKPETTGADNLGDRLKAKWATEAASEQI